jgi:epsilon-lactone hydrolase
MDDDPVRYQFRVGGHLGPTLLSAFPALVAWQQGTETVLTGLLPDAAALYGVLAEMEALGLDLLEVRQVRGESPGSGDGLSPDRGPA